VCIAPHRFCALSLQTDHSPSSVRAAVMCQALEDALMDNGWNEISIRRRPERLLLRMLRAPRLCRVTMPANPLSQAISQRASLWSRRQLRTETQQRATGNA
jgi:hypothetical protein